MAISDDSGSRLYAEIARLRAQVQTGVRSDAKLRETLNALQQALRDCQAYENEQNNALVQLVAKVAQVREVLRNRDLYPEAKVERISEVLDATGTADPLFDFRGVWHVRHADGSLEDIHLAHGDLTQDATGTQGQFILALDLPTATRKSQSQPGVGLFVEVDGQPVQQGRFTFAQPTAPVQQQPKQVEPPTTGWQELGYVEDAVHRASCACSTCMELDEEEDDQ
jgi:hypothetical protein